MSEDLAKLVVSMEAQSAKYIRDLKKSQAQTARWKNKSIKQSEQVSAAFNRLTIAAAVTASAVAIKSMVNQATQLATQTKNLSQLAGLTTTQFQRQAFAFETAGIQADKFADINKDVQERLGEYIATGGGGFADFFEQVGNKVGVTADKLQHLSGTDVLVAVKKAMDQANVSAKEQIFFMESIASDTTALLPLLANEGKAIRELTAEYDALGLGMSEPDIANLAQIAKENRKLERSFDALQVKLTGSLGPSILLIFEKITNGISRTVDIVKWAAEELAAAIHGPAFNDLTRINEQLASATAKADKLRALLNAPGPRRADATNKLRLAELNAEIDHLTQLKTLNESLSTGNAAESAPLEIGVTGTTGQTDEQKAQLDQAALDEFTRLQERLLTEEEAQRLSYTRRQQVIDEALRRKQITEDQALEERKRVQSEFDKWSLSQEKALHDAKIAVANNTLDLGIAIAKDGSKAERALLAVKKAIALKESLINLQAASAKALNLPFPANLGAIAQVALVGGGIITDLKSLSTSVPSFLGGGHIPDGPRTGGVDGFGGIPAILHPGETINDPKNPNSGGGGVQVNVHNYTGQRVDVLNNEKVIDIIVGEMTNQSSRSRNALHSSSNVQPRGRN